MSEYLVDTGDLGWFWKAIAAIMVILALDFIGGFLLGWFLRGQLF